MKSFLATVANACLLTGFCLLINFWYEILEPDLTALVTTNVLKGRRVTRIDYQESNTPTQLTLHLPHAPARVGEAALPLGHS